MGAKGEFKKNVIYICVVGFIHNNLILKINSSKKYIFFYSIGNKKTKYKNFWNKIYNLEIIFGCTVEFVKCKFSNY